MAATLHSGRYLEIPWSVVVASGSLTSGCSADVTTSSTPGCMIFFKDRGTEEPFYLHDLIPSPHFFLLAPQSLPFEMANMNEERLG